LQNEAGESLKNVLLVLSSAQLLVPPPAGEDKRTAQQVDLWEKSHARIGRILPGFLEDFVAQQPEPVSAVPAAAAAPTTTETPKEPETKDEAPKA
jgi:brefeldin A-resistance guanine nucleotide exchange factor 1